MALYPETLPPETVTVSDSPLWVVARIGNASDTFDITENLLPVWEFNNSITERFTLNHSILANMTTKGQVQELINFTDKLNVIFEILMQETISFADNVDYNKERALKIIDTLVVSDVAANRVNAYALLMDIAVFVDAGLLSFPVKISETFNLSDQFSNLLQAVTEAIEAVYFTGETTCTVSMMALSEETINFTEDISVGAQLTALIQDGVQFVGVLEKDGETYTYVINPETSALVEWTGYDFNSISNGLGATSTGIYSLGGSTDDGVNIDASYKTGLLDFGSNQFKQVPYAYLCIASDGNMILKVSTTHKGIKKEHWYELSEAQLAYDNARIQLGRGLKSRYWQFELTNKDGSDFELSEFDVLPLVLRRRATR